MNSTPGAPYLSTGQGQPGYLDLYRDGPIGHTRNRFFYKRHQSPVSQCKLHFAAYINVSCSAGPVNSGFWTRAMSILKGAEFLITGHQIHH